jgi:hypothetical protein
MRSFHPKIKQLFNKHIACNMLAHYLRMTVLVIAIQSMLSAAEPNALQLYQR